MGEMLAMGRQAFQDRRWRAAWSALRAADGEAPLEADDLELLATAAHLVGEDAECAATWARAHRTSLGAGDTRRAARAGFWLAFGLILHGEVAQAGGWLARARHVLDAAGDEDAPERGLLLAVVALGHLVAGETAAALRDFEAALDAGVRGGDVDLTALGRLGRGQSLVQAGRVAEGVDELDEVMVAVTAGEVGPVLAGLVYCAVIELCHDTFDVQRAGEWTAALSRWCDAQPDLVPYRGQCLVHRAEVLQLHGAWPEALVEAERALDHLSGPPTHPAAGAAHYRVAELQRLRGELRRAEESYLKASELGHDPQPGLAHLRLAQGRDDVAAAGIRRAVDEAVGPVARAPLLAAEVEVLLATGDVPAARAGADELADLAASLGAPVLQAVSAHARGLVLLAEGDPGAALTVLRPAWVLWRDLDAPYEAAQVRVALGAACRRLGDEEGAALELHAAELAFRRLGAATDLAAVASRPDPAPTTPAGGLSARELEVLGLVATGRTNRAIAAELVISEKTVARHVANIFTKLGVATRAAATAFAYDHGVVRPTHTDAPTRRRP